jgi:hypothetical protein
LDAALTFLSPQIAGMKHILHHLFGYSAVPRRPLLPLNAKQGDELIQNSHIQALMQADRALRSGKARSNGVRSKSAW